MKLRFLFFGGIRSFNSNKSCGFMVRTLYTIKTSGRQKKSGIKTNLIRWSIFGAQKYLIYKNISVLINI